MSHDSFSYFNHKKLIEYARRWANRYPDGFIQKIVLYSYASPNQEHFLKKNIPTQFMVVFEVAELQPKILSLMRKYGLRFDILKPANPKITFETIFEAWEKRHGYKFNHTDFPTVLHAWEKIEKDTEQNWTIHEGYPALIHSDFEFVFNPPREPSLINWAFLIKSPSGKLPEAVKTDESKLVLFSNGSKRNPRKDTQIRDKCREIAKRRWVNTDMTAEDLYNHPEIREAAGDKLPSLKTFRDRWMEGLNPKNEAKRLGHPDRSDDLLQSGP